jgi:transcriptional regulator with XRE-family HTH domain
MTLGAKLIELRTGKRLSQTEIAEKLGVSQSAYNKWESDASKPNIENFIKLCEFHEIGIYEMLSDLSSIIPNKNELKLFHSNHLNIEKLVFRLQESQSRIQKLIETQNDLLQKLLL